MENRSLAIYNKDGREISVRSTNSGVLQESVGTLANMVEHLL